VRCFLPGSNVAPIASIFLYFSTTDQFWPGSLKLHVIEVSGF
jgi:hypothetical protein